MFKKTFLLSVLSILLVCTNLFAEDYIVNGAGTVVVNGKYSLIPGESNEGRPVFKFENTSSGKTFLLGYMYTYNWDYSWVIIEGSTVSDLQSDPYYAYYDEIYYYNENDDMSPPLVGWLVDDYTYIADPPAPTLTSATPTLNYDTNLFSESILNNGMIGNYITITLQNGDGITFSGTNGTAYTSGEISISGTLPSGLSAQFLKISNTEVRFSLAGTATNHDNANNVSGIEIIFNDAVFTGGDAGTVDNKTKSDFTVDFIGEIYVASSGGDFTNLFDAVQAASDGDIIILAGEVFEYPSTIVIDKNLTIRGQGALNTFVQGNRSATVLKISAGVTVTIESLDIRRGVASIYGGGINNDGILYIIDCQIAACYSGQYGGGIYSSNTGRLYMLRSTVSGNEVNSAEFGAKGWGAGVCAYHVELTNCTFYGNHVIGTGWDRDTPYNNALGGGLYLGNISGVQSTITNCSFIENSAYNMGGGIYSGTNNLQIKNTIIINNSPYNASMPFDGRYLYPNNRYYSPDIAGNINTLTTSLIRIVNFTFGYPSITNQVGVNLFGVEGYCWETGLHESINGTYTVALMSQSPAIDAGTAIGAPITDQRGFSRNGNVDMGAYEFEGIDESLPVELSSFTAIQKQSVVELSWITESEVSNIGFNIYKSTDEYGGFVKINNEIIAGAGNSTVQNSYSYTDTEVIPGMKYFYQIEDVSNNGITEKHDIISIILEQETIVKITEYKLSNAYPNPFNPTTTIEYSIPEESFVKLTIFNLQGNVIEQLVNENKTVGNYKIQWNSKTHPSGVYLYKLDAGKFSDFKKCILVK